MVERISKNMGAEAMREATGKTHEGWRETLLAAGASTWTHRQIVDWLVSKHEVDGWWAQGITVDFEQTHQGRLPGQQADGTFSIARTRTIPGERIEALMRVKALVTARFGESYGENLAATRPIVRWRMDDGRRATVAANPPNKSGIPIVFTIDHLESPEAMRRAGEEIDEVLKQATP